MESKKKVCCTKTMHQEKKLQLTCLFDRFLFLLPRAKGTVINHTCRSTNLNVTSIRFCAGKHAITKVSRFFFESCTSCLATNRKDTIMANTFYYLAKSRLFFLHSFEPKLVAEAWKKPDNKNAHATRCRIVTVLHSPAAYLQALQRQRLKLCRENERKGSQIAYWKCFP